ncbi:MAG: hypothetical protein RL106_1264 [Bacteroidota bacterium]
MIGDGTPVSTTTPRSIAQPAAPRIPAPLGQRDKISQSKEIISISQLNNPTGQIAQGNVEEELIQEIADRAYNQDEVFLAWDSFLKSGKIPQGQLWAAMSLAQPRFSDNVLTLGFPSETQVIYFNDVRNDLAGYFKESHQMKGLTFITEVLKEVETHKNLMTVTQRFENLRQENPSIEKMYRLFQLRME